MGRGSGGGGGGHSGGGGGSHHSSGGSFNGFSGSRSSGGSSFDGGSWGDGGGYRRNRSYSRNYGRTIINNYGGMGAMPFYGHSSSSGASLSSLLLSLLIVALIFSGVKFFTAKAGAIEKMDPQYVESVSTSQLVVDNLGWVTEDKGSTGQKMVEKGISTFYNKTGVQPMLIVTDSLGEAEYGDSATEWERELESLYSEMFDDKGHMILCLNTLNGSDNYNLYMYLGQMADQTIGMKEQEKLADVFAREYNDLNQHECEMLADTFTKGAEALTRSKTMVLYGALFGISAVVSLLVFVYIIFKTVSKSKLDAEKERNRHAEAIDDLYDRETN